MTRTGFALALAISCLACRGPADPTEVDSGSVEVPATPQVDLEGMEKDVAARFRQVLSGLDREPRSAERWGDLGKVAHVHELFDTALEAYDVAERLDPIDARWPYFRGDILSVVGSDLPAAEAAFRRALERRPGYGPTHMRLAAVLLARGEEDAAAAEYGKALDLQADLQPARLALAQIRLTQGDLEESERLLREILRANPRHAQALSTLAQVTMRLGRRDEARRIAQRADEAAFYNLYSDPMMGEVEKEGRSVVLIWDRAQAFLETGNDEQAAIGLGKVVQLRPESSRARHQLALALRNLGNDSVALQQLEEVVRLDPRQADARFQLATLLVEADRAAEAVEHLSWLGENAPEDLDAAWLLGRALVQSGAPGRAVTAFERGRALAGAGGLPTPVWVLNDWGNALAQSGRLSDAVRHFEAALAIEPDNAQTLFFLGLIAEGQGRLSEAVDYHCRSMRAQPNAPAAGRLQALGRSC